MTDINIKLQQLDVTNATDNATLVYSQANNTLEYKVVTTDTSALEASINTVNSNLEALPDSAANDYSTYTTVTGLIDTVQANLTSVIGASPTALDTLAEIAAALENDANIAATLTTSIGTVSDNVTSLTSTTAANDYSTYNTLSSLIDTVQDNVSSQSSNTTIVAGGTDLSNTTVFVEAGDGVLLSSNTTSKTMTIATSMSNVTSQTISIDGTANSFTLTKSASNANMILVMYNGLVQDPSRYTISGTTLTLNNVAPIIAGANVEVRYFDFFSLPGVSESSGGGGSFTDQGSNYGYVLGGSGPAGVDTDIQKFSLTSDAAGTNIGDLNTATYMNSQLSSYTNGYSMGGSPAYNGTDKVSFSSDGNATDLGGLSPHIGYKSGTNSETHGYLLGGHTWPVFPGTSITDEVSKISYSAETTVISVGSLSERDGSYSGASSSGTYAYKSTVYTAYPAPDSYNSAKTIEKIPYASDTNGISVGYLAEGRIYSSGLQSDSHGYTVGGRTGFAPSPTQYIRDSIQQYSFSSDSDATDIAELYLVNGAAGISGQSYGHVAGGNQPPGTPKSDQIWKFPFASNSPGTDVAELAAAYATSEGTQY